MGMLVFEERSLQEETEYVINILIHVIPTSVDWKELLLTSTPNVNPAAAHTSRTSA